MPPNPRPAEIWLLDDAPSVEAYSQILALQFKLRSFDSLEELTRAEGVPSLIIIDPPTLDPLATVRRLEGLPLVISTRNDGLDFLKACLKGGVQAVCLKPLRQADVFLTLERCLGVELLPSELDGRPVQGLTLKERHLLASFLVHKQFLTRDELYEALWRGVSVNRKTLDVHLFNLRRKLHPLGFDIVCEGQAYDLRRQVDSVRLQEQFSVG